MARRSPNNPRYRKDAQIGSTRKSAASAKPKRIQGDRTAEKRRGGAPKKSKWWNPLPVPQTPEYKRLRRIWLGLFLAGAVLSIIALVLRTGPIATAALTVAYACLISAIVLDMTKIRRLRKELLAELQGGGRKAGDSSAGNGTEQKGR